MPTSKLSPVSFTDYLSPTSYREKKEIKSFLLMYYYLRIVERQTFQVIESVGQSTHDTSTDKMSTPPPSGVQLIEVPKVFVKNSLTRNPN